MGTRGSILVVDDDAVFRGALTRYLEGQDFAVEVASGAAQGLEALEAGAFDVVLTDLRMPGIDGIELVRRALSIDPDRICIVVTGFGSTERSVEALEAGAFWFVDKGYEDLSTIGGLIERAVEHSRLRRRNRELEQAVDASHGFDEIVGQSAALCEMLDVLRRVCDTETTVLITGESGTGKELVAQALHEHGPRRDGPFVAVNCGAIPETLLESELFGHVRGAFTGADRDRIGRFETARGGTLFLDEIGDMSFDLQRKLLRVLQEREFEPVGTETPRRLDARIVAATNQDLRQAIADGRFRDDLYYRLAVLPIHVPPLRDRAGDAALLSEHFVRQQARSYPGLAGVSDPALKRLVGYDWPGNVRELGAVIERAAILRREGLITEEDLPDSVQPRSPTRPRMVLPENGLDFAASVAALEADLITQALSATNGNKNQAAKRLGLKRTTLLEKIRVRGLA